MSSHSVARLGSPNFVPVFPNFVPVSRSPARCPPWVFAHKTTQKNKRRRRRTGSTTVGVNLGWKRSIIPSPEGALQGVLPHSCCKEYRARYYQGTTTTDLNVKGLALMERTSYEACHVVRTTRPPSCFKKKNCRRQGERRGVLEGLPQGPPRLNCERTSELKGR